MNITKHSLSTGSYYAESNPKDSIFLHHTQGHHRPDWVIDSWGRDRAHSTNKIRSGTAFVIGGEDLTGIKNQDFDGIILEAFSPDFWSHHLFTKTKTNTFLNQKSIGIEICNYGELICTEDGKFYTRTNILVPEKYVTILDTPFRGERYFHSYTEKQISSLKSLVTRLSDIFDIDIHKGLKKEIERSNLRIPEGLSIVEKKRWLNKRGIMDKNAKKIPETASPDPRLEESLDYLSRNPFDLSPIAVHGYQGLWSHSNLRGDIKDVYPSPLLVQMINSL